MVFSGNKWFDEFEIEKFGLDRNKSIAIRQIGNRESAIIEYKFSNEYLSKKFFKNDEDLETEEQKDKNA